jgi:hypothetical protein
MTPEHLGRIRAIYEAALETEPADRHIFVSQQCKGHEDLLREVERLLDARVPDWLSKPLLATDQFVQPLTPPHMRGRHLSGMNLFGRLAKAEWARSTWESEPMARFANASRSS